MCETPRLNECRSRSEKIVTKSVPVGEAKEDQEGTEEIGDRDCITTLGMNDRNVTMDRRWGERVARILFVL